MRVKSGMIRGGLAVIGFFCALGYSQTSFAYPENVRHGYTNCASCHVNPNGQGELNDYGRELSKAVQSNGKFFFEPSSKTEAKASSKENDEADTESQFLYGYFPHPKWLTMGGDTRYLQLFQNTPTVSSAQFIVMQLDLEAAVTVGKFTADATVGRVDPTYFGNSNPGFTDYLISRHHFLLYQATDELFVMGGRFWKPYGILDPNHSSTVKEGLGWNDDTESYNIEAGYIGSQWSVLGYASFGRPDTTYFQIEKGAGLTASLGFLNTYKAGVSYFYGYTDAFHRHVFGPWAILGFTEHFYLRTENDFVIADPTAGSPTSGFATYNRLGYEFVQGFHGFLEEGFNQLDLFNNTAGVPGPAVQIYGLGMLYYPRPHWEFEADLQERVGGGYAPSAVSSQYAYFQLHYYL